jgi:hypothetical protein
MDHLLGKYMFVVITKIAESIFLVFLLVEDVALFKALRTFPKAFSESSYV